MLKIVKAFNTYLFFLIFLMPCNSCRRNKDSAVLTNAYTIWEIDEDRIVLRTALFPVISLTDVQPPKEDSTTAIVSYNIRKEDSSFLISNTIVYMNPFMKASFPNGIENLTAFIDSIQKLQNYPPEGSIEWPCYVGFIIQGDGKITNVGMARRNAQIYVESCMEIIGKMPKWNPAIQNGRKVASFNIVRIKFNVK